jgi:hypothetical protein
MRSVTSHAATVVSVLILSTACTPEVDQGETQVAALSQAERDEIEQRLLGWTDRWVNTMLTGDLSVFERILAPDFIYTVNNGRFTRRCRT